MADSRFRTPSLSEQQILDGVKIQLRALGSYGKRSGGRDSPKETTFQRILAKLDAQPSSAC